MKSLSLRKILSSVLFLAAFLAVSISFVNGQEAWTPPYRMSTGDTKAGDPALVTDSNGYIHLFWPEEFSSIDRTLIQYSRFDGETWTSPVDIHISREFFPIGSIDTDVSSNGAIHVVWTEGFNGSVLYSRAPLENALSAPQWIDFVFLGVSASEVKIKAAPDGRIHVVYTRITGSEPGVYHIYSDDDGLTWSKPYWLDPDNPPDFLANSIYLGLDQEGGLHAAWSYKSPITSEGDWVRYARSLDGGSTWSQPFTIAKNDEGADELNAFARPVLIVSGDTVHIIWAGGDLLYRHHRYSEDRGATWTQTERILGNLNGQAGDGLAIDNEGRLHFFGQIRFPQGVWHAVWDGTSWNDPELIYLMRISDEDDYGGAIQAHRTFPAIRRGDQVVVTLTDPPQNSDRRLFTMIGQLLANSLPEESVNPTDTPTLQLEPETIAAPSDIEPTPTKVRFEEPDTTHSSNPSLFLWFGSIPALVIIIGAVIFRAISSRSR